MDLATLSTTISQVVELSKTAIGIAKKAATLPEQEAILSLREKTLEIKEMFLQLRDENHSLREEISKLRDQLDTKENLVFESQSYWLNKSDGSKDGPFCQKCYDSEGKLIRMHKDYVEHDLYYRCYHCENCFDPNPRPYTAPTRADSKYNLFGDD